MLLKKTIKLPVYDCNIRFILTDNIKQEVLKLCKKYKLPSDEDEEYEGLVIFPNLSNYYLIVDTKHLTYNTILHEMYHAATKVCKHRDIQDEESAAWVNGYIGSAIIKFLLKKDIKIK